MRDRRVAYAVGGLEVIHDLDALSQGDERALLQRAPGLSDERADAAAAGLGCHAQLSFAKTVDDYWSFCFRPQHYQRLIQPVAQDLQS